jgi:hypothetical protein
MTSASCYANQSKFWVIDPDGVEWEVYHVNHELVEKHGGGIERVPADPDPAGRPGSS